MPGGPNGSIQYNDSGSFNGFGNYDGTDVSLPGTGMNTFPPPTGLALGAASGGTLTAPNTTYYVVVTSATITGESTPSTEQSITLNGTTQTAINVSWSAPLRAAWVYVGTSPGGESRLAHLEGSSYVITALPVTPPVIPPPTQNTCFMADFRDTDRATICNTADAFGSESNIYVRNTGINISSMHGPHVATIRTRMEIGVAASLGMQATDGLVAGLFGSAINPSKSGYVVVGGALDDNDFDGFFAFGKNLAATQADDFRIGDGLGGTVNADGAWSFVDPLTASAVTPVQTTVASLPASPVVGMLANVSDSSTNRWGAAVSGGGSRKALVRWDGSDWIVASSTVASQAMTTTLTGSQAAIDVGTATLLRCNNSSLLTIQGIVAGYSGQELTVISVGAGQVDLANENGGATAADRITTGIPGTVSLAPGNGTATLTYDGTTQRWRVIQCRQADTLLTTASSTQTALDVTGLSVLRCNNSSLLTLQGLAGGRAGQQLTIVSVGSAQVDIENNVTAVGSNKILNGVTATRSLVQGVGSAMLVYDGSQWRVTQHEQGAPITPAFSAANFFGNGSMTWTVGSTDVVAYNYVLRGCTLFFNFIIQLSSVGGTLNTQLRMNIPGGFNPADQTDAPVSYIDTARGTGRAFCAPAVVLPVPMGIVTATAGNWSASSNTTWISGQMQIPVS